MTKLSKKELAQALARSSMEIAQQAAINAGTEGAGCLDVPATVELSNIERFGGKKAAPFGSKKRAAKMVARAARRKAGK